MVGGVIGADRARLESAEKVRGRTRYGSGHGPAKVAPAALAVAAFTDVVTHGHNACKPELARSTLVRALFQARDMQVDEGSTPVRPLTGPPQTADPDRAIRTRKFV